MRLLLPALTCAALSFPVAVLGVGPAPPGVDSQVVASYSTPALREAVQFVWKTSPEVAAARAELAAAQARALASDQPLYNPTLSVEAENADVDRRTGSVGLALDLFGKRRARASEGEAQLRVAQATFDIARRDIAGRWLKAWSAQALAGRQVEFGKRRVELMQRFDDLAAQRLAVGDISSPERDLAGLALGDAQLQKATLIANEAAQRGALAAIVANPSVDAPPLPEALPPSVGTLSERSVLELPELLEARAKVDRGDAAVEVARRSRIPDPTVSLTGGLVRSGLSPDRVTDRVIGVSVSIPLPVLNTGRADVAAAQAEADVAAATLRSRELALHAAQAEARTRYEALRDAASSFRQGRAGALDDRTAMLERLWRAGEISTSDFLVQLKQSLDTALSGVELESRTWQAWFDYLASAGRLTDWVDGAAKEISP